MDPETIAVTLLLKSPVLTAAATSAAHNKKCQQEDWT